MNLIDPNTLLQTQNSQIDVAHAEFVRLLNQMPQANKAAFSKLFAELLLHIEQHFNEENSLMEQSKFPTTGEHKAEHQRILGNLRKILYPIK